MPPKNTMIHRGGVNPDRQLPLQQKDRTKRGGEVVFDETKRRDFLNGFHKRKVARQKVAKKKIDKKARTEKIKERSERRANLIEARGGPAAGDKGEGEEDEVPVQRKLPGAGVQIYGSHIAVSVGGLDDDADEEDEEEEPDA